MKEQNLPTSTCCRRWLRLGLAVALALSGASMQTARAATRTWTGGSGVSGYWSASANWGGTVPTHGDDLVFPAGAARLTSTNNLTSTRFKSITFSGAGGGYAIYPYAAGTLLVSDSINSQHTAGANTIHCELQLQYYLVLYESSGGGTLTLAGDVDLNGYNINVNSYGSVTFSGAVIGTGHLNKTGTGTLELAGATANGFNGNLNVISGTVLLNKQGVDNALRGPLIIGDGSGTDTVRYLRSYQMSSAADITIYSSGTLDLNGFTDGVGGLTLEGGQVETGAGTITPGGDIVVNASATHASIDGQLNLNTASRVFDVALGGFLDVDATVTGSGGLVKRGDGFLSLRAHNTYSGVTTIEGGYLQAFDTQPLGASSSGTVLESGTLRLVSAVVTSESLEANGGWLEAIYASNAWTGPVTLNTNIHVWVPNAGEILNLAGAIGGTGGMTKTGPGILVLSGNSPNTYAGDTVVNAGILRLGKSQWTNAIVGNLIIGDGSGGEDADVVQNLRSFQIAEEGTITIHTSGLLDLNNFGEAIGALVLNGGDIETGTGQLEFAGDVTANAATSLATVSGRARLIGNRTFTVANGSFSPDLRIDASIAGGGLIKAGEGELSLTAANTYSGLTTVNAGLLDVDDSSALGSTTEGTVVATGASLLVRYNSHVGLEPLTLSGSGAFSSIGALDSRFGSNSWAGPISLSTEAVITINSGSDFLNLSGAIGGPAGFTKIGSGTLILSGPDHNTYAGATVVNAGPLLLSKTPNRNAIPGALIIGDGLGGSDVDVVRCLANFQMPSATDITIHSSGLLDLNGYSDTIGGLNFFGGDIETGGGTLTPTRDVTVNTTTDTSTVHGRMQLSGTRRFNFVAPEVLQMYAELTGSGGLIKDGGGYLNLYASNSFTGPLTAVGGQVTVSDDHNLGTTDGETILNGGTVELINVRIIGEPLRVDSRSTLEGFGTNLWTGDVLLNAELQVWPYATVGASRLEFSGVISGAGGLTKIASYDEGVLALSGLHDNTYTGDTRVNAGVLELAKSGGGVEAIGGGTLIIGDGTGGANADVVRYTGVSSSQLLIGVPIVINSSGLLDFNNHSDDIGVLEFNGGDLVTGTGIATLWGNVVVNANADSSATISGILNLPATRTWNVADSPGFAEDLRVNAEVRGEGGLTKTGAGLMVLTHASSFTGVTTVNSGTLRVQNATALGDPAGATVVNSGATLGLRLNVHVGEEPLTLEGVGHNTGGALASYSGSNSWSGPITLAGDTTIFVDPSDYLHLVAPIGGSGSVTKTGRGTLIMAGTGNNTYSGDTFVQEGDLLMGRTGGTGAVPHSLVIGGNTPTAPTAAARHLRMAQVFDHVTVNLTGSYELDGFDETIRDLNLNGGADVDTGGGTLTIVGDVNVDPVGITNAVSEITGAVGLNAAGAQTLHVLNAPSSGGGDTPELEFIGTVSGSAPLLKDGDGTLVLRHSNTFSGALTISDGIVRAYHSQALGSAVGGTTVNSNGVLRLGYNAHVVGESLTLDSEGLPGWTALSVSTGSNSWSGTVTLLRDTRISVSGGADLNLSGPIGGAGGFSLESGGRLILSGNTANTYAGATFVQQGVLELDKVPGDGAVPGRLVIGDGVGGAGADVVRLKSENQIANVSDVTIANSGRLDLNDYYERVDAVTGRGSVTLGSGHLIAGHNGSSFTFDGLVFGTGYLWKVGHGTWTLTADNTYSGTTRIQTGTLIVNGAQPDSAVLIQDGAMLGGTGTVGPITSMGGAVSPGLSPGALTGGNLALSGTSEFVVEINGTLPGAECDLLLVRGATDLGGAALDLSLGFTPAEGDRFMILHNDGVDPIVGTFAGLVNGATLTVDGVQFRINYDGGTGNDVVLTALQPPPPPALAIVRGPADSVVVSWPVPADGWLLQGATNLVTGGSTWTLIPPPYASNATHYLHVEPAPAGTRFYRLHKP